MGVWVSSRVRIMSIWEKVDLLWSQCHTIQMLFLAIDNIIRNLVWFVWSVSRADSRFAPSQWETALLCNGVSHWLGASLESAPVSIFCHLLRKDVDKGITQTGKIKSRAAVTRTQFPLTHNPTNKMKVKYSTITATSPSWSCVPDKVMLELPGEMGDPLHDDVIKWKHFPRYWTFCVGNSPVTYGFPALTKASDVELWCFLSPAPE